MTLRSDQKALLFLGAVAVLGAGVRVVRASGRNDVGAQPALERQAQAADSAAKSGRAPVTHGQGRGQRGKRASGAKTETARSRSSRASRDTSHAREGESAARARSVSGPLDHPGYVAGKLDLILENGTGILVTRLVSTLATMIATVAAFRLVRLLPERRS